MKAAVHKTYGRPDVVSLAEVTKPSPRDKDVLVAVHATTVNRTDCAYRAAKPFFVRTATGLTKPKRTVLGTEFAGVVVETGKDVTRFTVGDRVFGYNEGAFGTHAEFLSLPEDAAIAKVPDGVPLTTAAAGTEGSHYALAFIRVAGVEAGQEVLVYGATGGIGSAAVQLLKARDITVTAVCDTANVDLVKGLGADQVLDYTTGELDSHSHAYDAVFDAVGKLTFGRCRRLLKKRGAYLSSELGPWAQNIFLPLLTLGAGKRVKFPFPKHDQRMIEHLGGLLASGAFKPVIDRHYPLDRIVEAYEYVETGRKTGNVVIDVVAPD
jgi:NADPH:quinone reductase-like Zn-dependent oxidoreductase